MKILLTAVVLLSSLTLFAADTKDRNQPEYIRMIMNQNSKKFNSCYSNALTSSKKPFDFKSTIKFTITKSGKVTKVKIQSKSKNLSLVERGLSECVKKVVYNFAFPESPDGRIIDVSQPMNFRYPRK